MHMGTGVTTHLAGGVNVADIGCDTRRTTDIVEAQGGDEFVLFEEQRERLANASSGAEDGDFCLARGRGRELARVGRGAGCCTEEHGEGGGGFEGKTRCRRRAL